jgi:4-amino-4-deoxy-L-arabinose transferase-like glycosyltransferase
LTSVVGRRCTVVVGGLTIAAFLLRAPQLDQSLFGDELWALYAIAGRSLHGTLAALATDLELNPPLFFVLAWASSKLGDPTVWIRLPSLASGVALVPATYLLGRRTVGRLAGLVAAGAVALAPFAIEYSIEARPYMTLAFLTVASTICLLGALEGDRTIWWAAYAVASAAALYTHYTAVLVLGVQCAWAAWARRERLGKLAVSNAAAALLFLPWIPQVLRGPKPGVLAVVYGPFVWSPGALARSLTGVLPGSPFTPLGRLPGGLAAAAFAGGLALALAGALSGLRCRPTIRRASPTVLGLLLAPAVSAGLLAIAAALGHNLFGPRTLITAFPYAALAIGWLIVRSPALAGGTAGLLVAGSLAVGAVDTIGADGQRPRYRDAAHLIAARVRPGDVVLERELWPNLGPLSNHLAIYLPPRITHLREGPDDARAWAAARRGGRVFFVQVIAPAPRGRIPATLGPDRLVTLERRELPGFLPVSVTTYGRPGVTRG